MSEAAIPEVSSAAAAGVTATAGPQGAQTATAAPAGTIPAPIKAYSDRPDSAKSKMMERLRSRSTGSEAPKAEVKKPAPADTVDPTDEDATDKADEPKEEPKAKAAEKTTEKAEEKAADKPEEKAKEKTADPDEEDLMDTASKQAEKPGDKKKVNPWKLIDEHKAKRAELEKEIVELRRMMPNAEARKQELAEIETLRREREDMSKRLSLLDFQSSEEYKTQYEKPYQEAWSSAMKELRGVTVSNEDGTGGREITPQDLLELVNMPVAKARQVARDAFGDYADDVMAQRQTIRGIFDKQQQALVDAKEKASDWVKGVNKQQQEQLATLNKEIKEIYDKATANFAEDPNLKEIFKDVEGDDEANSKLAKGYEMVDRAFASNPMDPNLSPDQRAKIVKSHAAMRHRAAAFGKVRHLLMKERADHEATKKRLAEYESTEPNRGTPRTAEAAKPTGTAMSRMLSRLREKASK